MNRIPEWNERVGKSRKTVFAPAQLDRERMPITDLEVSQLYNHTCWFCADGDKYFIDYALSDLELATVDPMVRLYDAFIVAGEEPPAELVARLCAFGE